MVVLGWTFWGGHLGFLALLRLFSSFSAGAQERTSAMYNSVVPEDGTSSKAKVIDNKKGAGMKTIVTSFLGLFSKSRYVGMKSFTLPCHFEAHFQL